MYIVEQGKVLGKIYIPVHEIFDFLPIMHVNDKVSDSDKQLFTLYVFAFMLCFDRNIPLTRKLSQSKEADGGPPVPLKNSNTVLKHNDMKQIRIRKKSYIFSGIKTALSGRL